MLSIFQSLVSSHHAEEICSTNYGGIYCANKRHSRIAVAESKRTDTSSHMGWQSKVGSENDGHNDDIITGVCVCVCLTTRADWNSHRQIYQRFVCSMAMNTCSMNCVDVFKPSLKSNMMMMCVYVCELECFWGKAKHRSENTNGKRKVTSFI